MIRFSRVNPRNRNLVMLQAACLPNDIPRDFSADTVWIGREGRTPVAFCSIRALDDGQWYLSRAGVVPSARGKGLQKRMIRLRVAFARAHDAGATVITDCTFDNYASANSLMTCGFRLYSPERRWSFHDALYWRHRCP
jgi:predicted acetyltransferase